MWKKKLPITLKQLLPNAARHIRMRHICAMSWLCPIHVICPTTCKRTQHCMHARVCCTCVHAALVAPFPPHQMIATYSPLDCAACSFMWCCCSVQHGSCWPGGSPSLTIKSSTAQPWYSCQAGAWCSLLEVHAYRTTRIAASLGCHSHKGHDDMTPITQLKACSAATPALLHYW
ncbi:hypothetical protein COO60DRAFT_1534410 [Scenedesmus sp. NREL 46B-D3]|nr:hypothetical protein COO60DRAFT_1534410 [Scenedesmus sp. NREL 46B-D3]